jgi:hypothetical protein
MSNGWLEIGGERFYTNPIALRVAPWWAGADPNPWPRFVLFPRLERARIACCSGRTRVRRAWVALRSGDGTQSEWEDA